jgi:hypothetical protein
VIRLLSVACLSALVFGALVAFAPGQEADEDQPAKKAKPAAKKADPAAKVGKPSSAAVARPRKDWTGVELGGTKEPYAEITHAAGGKPVLAIHFPWRVYSQPSIEVRWMGDQEADTRDIRPLQFVADVMKGQLRSDVYTCRDKAADTPIRKAIKVRDRDGEILGDRNLLGKPAATVILPELPRTTETTEATDHAARAVFFPLDSWAVDRRTLWLELPAAHFSEPGRIRVWFYREGNLLWWKTVAWPGPK